VVVVVVVVVVVDVVGGTVVVVVVVVVDVVGGTVVVVVGGSVVVDVVVGGSVVVVVVDVVGGTVVVVVVDVVVVDVVVVGGSVVVVDGGGSVVVVDEEVVVDDVVVVSGSVVVVVVVDVELVDVDVVELVEVVEAVVVVVGRPTISVSTTSGTSDTSIVDAEANADSLSDPDSAKPMIKPSRCHSERHLATDACGARHIPARSPLITGGSTHAACPTPKRRATRSKSNPDSSKGSMSRANSVTPGRPGDGAPPTQLTMVTWSPTSECSSESIAANACQVASETSTPPAASSTWVGVASGQGGPSDGASEPGGNTGLSAMNSARFSRASSMSNCATAIDGLMAA
jgi:hypothetical protein